MAEAINETKAQRAERLKQAKNPWECFEEIREFARRGYDAIPPEWLSTYFRWWGVYTQGDGEGAVGGIGGEGKATPYFMVRIRIPNGLLTSQQLRTIASLAEQHARGFGDITVRQNIQLHWVTIQSLPNVMQALWNTGLITMASCGDVTRNVTGCPLAGLDADQICDASPLVLETTRFLVGNGDFYNLPRKWKICITGCGVWCSYPEINDVGLTAVRRGDELGFSLRVGGGLATEPHLAVRLNAFVRWKQVFAIITALSEIFRDADVLRENRKRARLKYLFLRYGWTPDSFLRELECRLGFRLDPAVEEQPPEDLYRDHVGIHPQLQPGYSYVGAAVLRGRLTAEQMRAAADLAEQYGRGQLRTTNMQNLVIVNVPNTRASGLARELDAIGLPTEASPFWRGAVACTGTEFCKLAITETKAYTQWLVRELEERMPAFSQHLKLNITGCPNSCGQHWIADIGLEGKKIKAERGRTIDAYYFCVGGGVGANASIARPVGYRCPAAEVPDAIERLVNAFRSRALPGESLRSFLARHATEDLRSFLAGGPTPEVARDLPAGPVPHGVEA